jgi:hypothetical protein
LLFHFYSPNDKNSYRYLFTGLTPKRTDREYRGYGMTEVPAPENRIFAFRLSNASPHCRYVPENSGVYI